MRVCVVSNFEPPSRSFRSAQHKCGYARFRIAWPRSIFVCFLQHIATYHHLKRGKWNLLWWYSFLMEYCLFQSFISAGCYIFNQTHFQLSSGNHSIRSIKFFIASNRWYTGNYYLPATSSYNNEFLHLHLNIFWSEAEQKKNGSFGTVWLCMCHIRIPVEFWILF